MVKRSINEFAIRLGKPFHDKNFLISLSSVLILLGVQILCTRSISALTQEILCRQGTKLSKLVYCPVKVSFAIRLGKPFHDKNFLISLSSVLILLGVQILCTRSISALKELSKHVNQKESKFQIMP